MIDIIREFFSYGFITRALIGGVLLSLCAALLGVSLVLKRYSMIGDGLSHVGFGALAIAMAMNWSPMGVAIPVVVVAAVLLLRLSESSRIKGDAAIGLISTGALAVGVMAISLTSGMNVDVYNYMFGSILAMSQGDVIVSAVLSVLVIGAFVLLYNRIFSVTFDEEFARATGTHAGLYNLMTAVLTAVTIVVGMRMMGAMLISSLILFPSLTAMRVCKRFCSVVVVAGVVAVVCFCLGLVASYSWGTPAGASVVVANILAFGVFSLAGLVRRRA